MQLGVKFWTIFIGFVLAGVVVGLVTGKIFLYIPTGIIVGTILGNAFKERVKK